MGEYNCRSFCNLQPFQARYVKLKLYDFFTLNLCVCRIISTWLTHHPVWAAATWAENVCPPLPVEASPWQQGTNQIQGETRVPCWVPALCCRPHFLPTHECWQTQSKCSSQAFEIGPAILACFISMIAAGCLKPGKCLQALRQTATNITPLTIHAHDWFQDCKTTYHIQLKASDVDILYFQDSLNHNLCSYL